MTEKRIEFLKRIHIHDNWISVDGIGRIGIYASYEQAILLDHSMIWIVGTNDRIYCNSGEIENKICDLFLTEKIIRGHKLKKIGKK